MEIIEISENSINKKSTQTRSKTKQETKLIFPPEVLSRPKSPEFTKKEEKIAEPKKVKEKSQKI